MTTTTTPQGHTHTLACVDAAAEEATENAMEAMGWKFDNMSETFDAEQAAVYSWALGYLDDGVSRCRCDD